MKLLHILLFLSLSLSAFAQKLQTDPIRLYRVADNITTADSAGNITGTTAYGNVSVNPYTTTIVQVAIKSSFRYYPIAKFLNQAGTPYSTVSANAAITAYQASIPTSVTGGSTTIDTATTVATKAYVNPKLAGKVDVIVGKALSANDFTSALLAKLNGIATGATSVTNNSQLPNGAGYLLPADIAGKQATLGFTPANVANNLSDLSNSATARTNLGLGSLSTQNANAVAFTGGTATLSTVTTTGNASLGGTLGVGVTAGSAPITLGTNLGEKLTLYSGLLYGVGLQGGQLQIKTNAIADHIAFGYGPSASLGEVARIMMTGGVLIGTSTDVASSILTMSSTSRGMLPPRMTTTQRNAISSPAQGLVIYNTTTNKLEYNNASVWTYSSQLTDIVTYATSTTAVTTDSGAMIMLSNASANTYTVPPNAIVSMPIGTTIKLTQTGAGQTTITAGAGVTLSSAGGALKTRVQYSWVTLIKTGTDTWLVLGDLTT